MKPRPMPPRRRSEAIHRRTLMLQQAARLAKFAGDERLSWGKRYEFAVLGDDALQHAKEADDFLRKFFERA